MPELPEVQTIVHDLGAKLNGRRFVDVDVYWQPTIAEPEAEAFRRQMIGEEITGLWRRAKFVVMGLSGGNRLVIHLRMTGRLLWMDAEAPADKHTRVVLHLDNGKELRLVDTRKFARIRLLTPAGFEALSASLGIEPLGKEFTKEKLREIVRARGQKIKALLLDQRYIVGLGNIYADEALFVARIHPLRPANSLTAEETERLYSAIQRVLEAGIEDRGTTIDTYLDAMGRPGRHQSNLNVYHRTGEPCLRCGTPIERITIGGRSTHFCPQCQPMASPASGISLPSRKVRSQRG
ncbi:MAG: bifunctional DNA-formamidopyrimidine glycosylase/DNA-(apurinic or apyrimidinic site) lyase [Chloroflexi bacterium]|nr:bifunctional DNA-formamidopyrimidine glycosylase/DNA-(apurinic or apyrimidinic site) lyase [Chloroflexota bacterium]MDA8189734.1 bifunctional DNA-formamidopyrimidine glycosylase/DNA-(apurinic or apyrimidinic site) lyase [Dehalococcoidales bacterium]